MKFDIELLKSYYCEIYFFFRNPTWWKRRTSMERALTLISTIFILIGIALAIALGIVLYKTKATTETDAPYNAEALTHGSIINSYPIDDKPQNICLTPGCIHAASKVLEFMDASVDPCDDFYQFSCGSFIKKTNIPDDKSSVTTFSVINDQLEEQLRTMIEEPIQQNEPKPFILTKKLYKACMNKTKIEKIGLSNINEIIGNFGGWPVLEGENWKEGDFDWRQAVYKFRKAGYSVDYLIDFSVGIDLKNSTKRIIDLDQASLGLRREFLIKGLEDKLVKAYYDYMVDIAVIFGADKERAKKDLSESLEFEMKLANISLPNEERRNATALYNAMTIRELQVKYQSIPWLEYINTLLAPDTVIDNDEVIIVSVPKYLTDFEALMSVTPKRIQANYLLWRAVASSVSYLTEELRNRQLQYHTIATGKTERVSRWKECIDIVAGSMANAAGALYVRKYFHEDARQNAKEMVADIRAEFKEILKKVDWMDDKTRQSALEKADAMATHIAYPDELLDNSKLEEFYHDLDLNSDQYLKSAINLTLFATRYSFRRLRQPVNKTDWITHGRPAIVNAFYSSIENSILRDVPHNILFNIKLQKCIIDQYGNYTVPEVGLNLKGINTQGENIADNGGLKEAYYAYNSWTKRNRPEPKLPGLDYTPNQMFWISAANVWCARYRPETLKMRILTGYHSPGNFRVIGPMSNFEEFSKDFNCPSGTNMNPKNKCAVW
ncbi:Nep2 [Trypoxylus dichotomus]